MNMPCANSPDFALLMPPAVATPPLSGGWMPEPFQFSVGYGRVGKTHGKTDHGLPMALAWPLGSAIVIKSLSRNAHEQNPCRR